MYILAYFLHLTLFAGVQAATIALSIHQNAIVPTSSGQIGVNPVTVGIGPAEEYLGPIGTDTNYLTPEGSTTKWIGVNTEYLTLLTVTTTADSMVSTITSTVQLSVETATTSADGISPGDVSVLLPEAFVDALEGSVKTAMQTCNAGVKIRKRDDPLLTATEASKPGVVMGSSTQKLAAKLKFKQGEVGPTSTQETPSSTSSTCNPTATTDENSPGCDDTDCKGEDKKCTTGSNNGCPCLENALEINESYFDKDYWDDQQKLLALAAANPAPTAPPSCFANTNGKNFQGEPAANPESWCVCTSAGKTGIYSTVESPTPPCAYDTLPSQTISISVSTPVVTGSPTSCRFITETETEISPTGVFTSCTCDNNMRYLTVETTVDGSATVGCPTVTSANDNPPTSTSSPVQLPLNKPKCSDDNTTFARDGDGSASNTATSYCQYLINKNMQFTQGGGWSPRSFGTGSFVDPNSKTSDSNKRISVVITANQGACAQGVEFKVDFKAMGLKECTQNFMVAIDGCLSVSGPGCDKAWKGGVNYNDCAI
ncbi:hypothetical protein K432DRAFT_447449 [Lepidopterella palustris CBS 459.81]|uniref:Uncharacterized protein n=1 Tax=Lepidopterella palustris CBS 459.81 TaxID=1314670 RepID=A0A8E2DYM3_9PEZI|nr:hypothetical protein K432DRAFT_447449 [Lepidopterella palustris CBS 459.81]